MDIRAGGGGGEGEGREHNSRRVFEHETPGASSGQCKTGHEIRTWEGKLTGTK